MKIVRSTYEKGLSTRMRHDKSLLKSTCWLFGKGGTKHIMNRFKISSLTGILVILLAALRVRSVTTKAAPTTSCSWQVVPSPNDFNGTGGFNGVAAFSSSDVWAVGGYSGGALTEHWDGTGWSVVANLASNSLLYSVITAPGTNQAWAVGYSSVMGVGTVTLIEHWDGSSWSVVSSPTIGTHDDLFGVVALSTNNVWAVGDHFSKLPQHTLIEHWDGLSWHNVYNSNLATLSAITRIALTNQLWTVGSIGNANLVTFTEFHC